MRQLFAVLILSLVFSVVQAETMSSDELTLMTATPSVATKVIADQRESVKKYYASAVVGIAAYPEVSNVDKGYNVSAAAGYYFNDRVMFDLGFGLAKSQMSVKNLLVTNQRDSFDINQYQGNLGAKYQLDGLFDTAVKPVAGAVLSYTYRKYNLLNGLTTSSGNTGSSTALDAGFSAGLDYDLSQTYVLGLDFKYMFNLSNKVSSNYTNPSYGYDGISIEKLQYYIAGLSARMNF